MLACAISKENAGIEIRNKFYSHVLILHASGSPRVIYDISENIQIPSLSFLRHFLDNAPYKTETSYYTTGYIKQGEENLQLSVSHEQASLINISYISL